MSRQRLQDARFKTIGYIDTEPGGKQVGRNARFMIVGYFDPGADRTTDARFRVVGYGNILSSLIVLNP